jgi:hypothetical protein
MKTTPLRHSDAFVKAGTVGAATIHRDAEIQHHHLKYFFIPSKRYE